VKFQQAHKFAPYTFVQSAKRWEKQAMERIIREDNIFHARDYDAKWNYTVAPDYRVLDRNSNGYSVKVECYLPEGTVVYFEQFVRCRECREINLLSGGCTLCSLCGTLLEDNN
jgi:hypothetical protein